MTEIDTGTCAAIHAQLLDALPRLTIMADRLDRAYMLDTDAVFVLMDLSDVPDWKRPLSFHGWTVIDAAVPRPCLGFDDKGLT